MNWVHKIKFFLIKKVTKNLETLLEIFNAIAMVSSFGNSTFDETTSTISAKIEWRKNVSGTLSNSGYIAARAAQAETPNFDELTMPAL